MMMMMKAVEFSNDHTGPTIVENAPRPSISNKNHVLVKVINTAIDTCLDIVTNGQFGASVLHSKMTKTEPSYLGWHYSGTVVEVGVGVDDLDVGTAVFGHLQYDASTKQGSLSEYILVQRSECAIKPDNVPFDVAAASTTEGLTALQALRDHGRLKSGQNVLIFGGGGGVGSAAIGIAKCLGALEVTAVCSTRDVERVKAMGADVVIDRNQQDPAKVIRGKKYHVILDTCSSYPAQKWLGRLSKEGGVFVTTWPNWGLLFGTLRAMLSLHRRVRFVHVVSKQKDLELLGEWLSRGELKVPIDSTFKVVNIEAALDRQNVRGKMGRVVVDVSEGW